MPEFKIVAVERGIIIYGVDEIVGDLNSMRVVILMGQDGFKSWAYCLPLKIINDGFEWHAVSRLLRHAGDIMISRRPLESWVNFSLETNSFIS